MITIFVSIFLLFLNTTFGQIKMTNPIPDLPSVQMPQSYNFRPVNTIQSPLINAASVSIPQNGPITNINNTNQPANNQLQQYEQDLKAVQLRDQQVAETQKELKREKFYREYLERMEETKVYRNTFSQLVKEFNPDSFSIIKATYLVENAYYNNTLPYDKFVNAINARVALVKQILNREHLSLKNNTALNYGIQKLFSQPNNFYVPQTKQYKTIPAVKYDFDDYKGEKDYSQVFVSKLLMSDKGQCHSMPLLYLAIAEQLGAKAYLSLAPQHSFIQFFDERNNRQTFETTNGNLVSQNWMLQSGFINAAALKNRTYVDTLSQRKLYAQCLADLLLGYEKRFGYDDFAEAIRAQILAVDPTNLTAKIVDANIKTVEAQSQIRQAGNPPFKDLPNFPEAYAAYQKMMESYKQIDDLGYQDMPEQAYQAWRSSIQQEKKKQQTREVKAQMQREIDWLKKLKPTFTTIPKG